VIASALVSTHAIKSSSVLRAVPGHVSLSGQLPHQVIVCGPGVHLSVPPSHDLPSWTLQPIVPSHVARSVITMHALPVPHWQQKLVAGLGARLPHLFLIVVCFFVSAFASFSCITGSARQLAFVPSRPNVNLPRIRRDHHAHRVLSHFPTDSAGADTGTNLARRRREHRSPPSHSL
jgi:hypothetical protein